MKYLFEYIVWLMYWMFVLKVIEDVFDEGLLD